MKGCCITYTVDNLSRKNTCLYWKNKPWDHSLIYIETHLKASIITLETCNTNPSISPFLLLSRKMAVYLQVLRFPYFSSPSSCGGLFTCAPDCSAVNQLLFPQNFSKVPLLVKTCSDTSEVSKRPQGPRSIVLNYGTSDDCGHLARSTLCSVFTACKLDDYQIKGCGLVS